MIRARAARPLLLLPLLAACSVSAPNLPGGFGGGSGTSAAVPPPPPPIASVRHVSSTEPYGDGRLHLFLFTPEAPRSLDTRLASARANVSADPDCDWIDAPRDVIVTETAKQGADYADTLLVVPLDCS